MKTRGFTLIELMIAVAITALVMAMVGGILVSTIEANEMVNASLSAEKVGYGVVSIMRRDLEACYSYALNGQAFNGERASEGAGMADRVSFVAAAEGAPDPQTGRRPKFQRIGYRLKADQSGQTLSLFRYAEGYNGPKDGDPLAPGTFAFMATGIKSLKLSYLDPKDKVWHDDEWKETDRVPLAVKIHVDLPPAPNDAQANTGYGPPPARSVEAVVSIPTMFGPYADLPDQNTPPTNPPK
jgi:general secretion pathway protein J